MVQKRTGAQVHRCIVEVTRLAPLRPSSLRPRPSLRHHILALPLLTILCPFGPFPFTLL